jgi:hypothetical protein
VNLADPSPVHRELGVPLDESFPNEETGVESLFIAGVVIAHVEGIDLGILVDILPHLLATNENVVPIEPEEVVSCALS